MKHLLCWVVMSWCCTEDTGVVRTRVCGKEEGCDCWRWCMCSGHVLAVVSAWHNKQARPRGICFCLYITHIQQHHFATLPGQRLFSLHDHASALLSFVFCFLIIFSLYTACLVIYLHTRRHHAAQWSQTHTRQIQVQYYYLWHQHDCYLNDSWYTLVLKTTTILHEKKHINANDASIPQPLPVKYQDMKPLTSSHVSFPWNPSWLPLFYWYMFEVIRIPREEPLPEQTC